MKKQSALLENNLLNIPANHTGSYLLDLSKADKEVCVSIGQNSSVDLLLLGLRNENNISINIDDNSSVKLSALVLDLVTDFCINANVNENSTLNAYLADFIIGKCKGKIDVNLNKENATINWLSSSLSINNDNKELDVSVNHNSPRTFAQIDSYGVCRNNGKLLFSGICHIFNGSHGSKAHQNAKIMVFDKVSNGIARPILKIDDNDIEASHAAIVGKINDEHIFYLTSRGLSEDEAKRLITLGYLKPILKGFDDEDIRNEIEQLIEGGR